MKMRKMGSYDGKDLYKGGDGSKYTKGKDGKMSKLGDEYDESKLSKAKKEGDEEDYDVEEDDAKKSITGEDLRKSIEALQSFAAGTADRKTELLQKAQTGLNPEEAKELYELQVGQSGGEGGGEGAADPLSKSVTDELAAGTNATAAFDVAPFLHEQHEKLSKSLGTLADAIEGQGQRGHEFNLVMARALADVGNMVKSMSESQTADAAAIRKRLGIIEQQPTRAPKSVGLQGAQPMAKSFGEEQAIAGEGPFDGMTKAQVFEALNEMTEAGIHSAGGVDIMRVTSRLEDSNNVIRPVMNDITAFRKNKAKEDAA